MMEKIIFITGGGRGIGAAFALLAARCPTGIQGLRQLQKRLSCSLSRCRRHRGHGRHRAGDTGRRIRRGRHLTNVRVGGRAVWQAYRAHQQRRYLVASDAGRIMATNVTGSFLCAREAVRSMSTKHGGSGGSIVNIFSRAAVLGSAGEYVDYAASKAAMDALTIGLSKEVADEKFASTPSDLAQL